MQTVPGSVFNISDARRQGYVHILFNREDKAMAKNDGRWVLSYDLSTDALFWVVRDQEGEIVRNGFGEIVFYDKYGPALGLAEGHGYIDYTDGKVRIPVSMAISAVMQMLKDVKEALRDDVAKIVAVCGGVQQHGMVMWNLEARETLARLTRDFAGMAGQLIDEALASNEATSWRDTTSAAFADALLANRSAPDWAGLTGSEPKQSLRFLGLQIGRQHAENAGTFDQTSQFNVLASLPITVMSGKLAPIGHDEASCTMMMNLDTRQWAPGDIGACYPPQTFSKLPDIVAPGSPVATMAPYWCKQLGYAEDCQLLMNLGDNPAAHASMGLLPGQWAKSFGNSGVTYASLQRQSFDPDHCAHVMAASSGLMGMYCTDVSGDFAEAVRGMTDKTWQFFDEESLKLERDRNQRLQFVFPREKRPRSVNASDSEADLALSLARCLVARTLLGSKFLGTPTQLYLAGGLAQGALPQVAANMTQAPVVLPQDRDANRVECGAAAHAMSHAFGMTVADAAKMVCPDGETVQPDAAMADFYRNTFLPGFAEKVSV